MTKLAPSLICFSLLIATTLCWWDGGHIITAQIAKDQLLKTNPALYEQIETLVLLGDDLGCIQGYDFAAAATWADDVKGQGLFLFDSWHLINQPLNPDGVFIDQQNQPENNLVWAIGKAKSSLVNDKGLGKRTIEKSMTTKLLMHFIGDLHQPLHTVSFFNDTLVKGDLGGNLIKIHYNLTDLKISNLHAFWDSGAGLLPQMRERPVTEEHREEVRRLAKQFAEEIPRSALAKELSNKDVSSWARESYYKSKYEVYGPLLDNMTQTIEITKEYRDKSYELVKRQLVLGGYRLADLLTEIFEKQFSGKGFVEQKFNQFKYVQE